MHTRIKSLFVLILMGGSLCGASPQESLAVQELRLALEQMGRKLHSQSVEVSLFQERALALENLLNSLKQELKSPLSDKALERRTAILEKAHEILILDFKTLKSHINETNTSIAQCQAQIAKIDKHISSDIVSLKTSMQSILSLLQGEARSYTVQAGDSLGKIALDHKTDIKTLKKLNNFTSDTIFAGQKIILP